MDTARLEQPVEVVCIQRFVERVVREMVIPSDGSAVVRRVLDAAPGCSFA